MATKAQAVAFGEHVHQALCSGRARSVNQAVKLVNKTRRTLDRFRHIYYMAHVDKQLLEKVRIHGYVSLSSYVVDVLGMNFNTILV